ncbi:hypothetical protein ACFLRX_08730 [Acidobacteriota bacterium]
MNKVFNFKSLGLFCLTLFLFVTVIVVFSNAQAVNNQVGIQGKPIKPPGKDKQQEATWGAQIPFYGNLLGMGEDHVYDSSDPLVNVLVQRNNTSGNTSVNFWLYANEDPPDPWAEFSGVFMDEIIIGPEGPGGYCGFPGFGPLENPVCLEGFFNSQHPKQGYEHILFSFVFIGADFEDLSMFPMDEEILWTGSGVCKIYIWNNFDPLTEEDPEPYHSVRVVLNEYCTDAEKGIFITRTATNTWEIRTEQQVFDISEHYSWEEPDVSKKGRPRTITTHYTSLEAKANMSYKIRLIKNPN